MDAAERQQGASAMAGLCARLPPRLSVHASIERLRVSAAFDTVPLDEGAEILLALDALIGDGSGKLLESIGVDLAARVLSQGGGVARAGDLLGTVARLRTFLEHPFVGVPLVFDLRRSKSGFSLTVGVTGHSRATRAQRYLTSGAIIAAERFARAAFAETLKLYAENIADRASISARYLNAAEASEVATEARPPSRRPAPARAASASLSEEVERILRSSSPPRRPSDSSQLSGRPSELPTAIPTAAAPTPAPSLPAVEETRFPESSTYRVHRASSSPPRRKSDGSDRS